ncbi:LTA synthase family protein [Vagococcus sp.]|uniref:LTA synthase family protein n=1 Tax=Vagococcus sp. TaxID=1933889 RepID=UPI003F989CDB
MSLAYQIITYLFIGSFFGGLHYLFSDPPKSFATLFKKIAGQTLFINVLSLVVIRFVLNKPNALLPRLYATNFIWKYLLFTLIIGFIYLLVHLILTSKIIVRKNNKMTGKKKYLIYFGLILACLLFTIGSFAYLGTNWFIEYFGELTPEQFLFNLNSPISGTASGVYDSVLNTPVLKLIGCVTLFIFLITLSFQISWKDKKIVTDRPLKIILCVIAVLVLIKGGNYSIQKLQLKKVKQAYFSDSQYIKNNYVDPKEVKLEFPSKKRNLIHLYLESYENSFYDRSLGGYMEKNLMPELAKLSEEGLHFSNNDKFGGPHQTYGSSWSVASMVNQSAGLPLKIPMRGNDYGKSGYFLPGATTIGDILNQEGYNQTIMFGADADFGGLTSFFTNHKDFHIFDVKYAREQGLIPMDYNVWWGFEDKKLYQYAKDELTRLDKEGKPFNFTMENADTHFPDGYIEEDTPRPFDNQYANVIAHSQKEIVELVRWIQAQPFYENTTIVLTGDHPSMDRNFFKGWDPSYQRTTTNLILNGDFKNSPQEMKTTFRDFSPFDFYPTTLSAMGVTIPGNRLGLGTDLTSNEKTLIERDGLDTVNNELAENSKFYNVNFVSERKIK